MIVNKDKVIDIVEAFEEEFSETIDLLYTIIKECEFLRDFGTDTEERIFILNKSRIFLTELQKAFL